MSTINSKRYLIETKTRNRASYPIAVSIGSFGVKPDTDIYSNITENTSYPQTEYWEDKNGCCFKLSLEIETGFFPEEWVKKSIKELCAVLMEEYGITENPAN